MPTSQVDYHVTLEVNGVTYGFMLHPENFQYQEVDVSSFAPKIASGDMRFSDQTIYSTWLQEDFSHGFGFREWKDEKGYAYSEHGIDTRFPHMVMLATKLADASTMDTGLTLNAPRKFIEYDGNVYVITDAGVYKWDTANTKWISVGQDTGACQDALNDGDNLYVTMNGARARYYNGTTWADVGQANFTDMQWMCMASGWAYASDDSEPYVHYTAVPTTDWEGGDPATGDPDAIRVGAGNIPIQGLISFQGALYVAREDGLWYVPGDVAAAYQNINYAMERDPRNFQTMCVWRGAMYFTIKNSLWRLTGSTIMDVTPPTYRYDYPYWRYGNFKFLTPAGPFLYVVAEEDDGTTASTYGSGSYGSGAYGGTAPNQVLLCYDGLAWHRLLELASGTDTVTAMGYTPVSNKLWIGINKGTGADEIYYIPLRSNSDLPYASYETTTAPPDASDDPHYLYTSEFDAGLATVTKHYSQMSVLGVMGTSIPIDIHFSTDGGSWRHLGTFDDDSGAESIVFPTDTTGKTIRFRINLQSTSETATPVLQKLVMQYLPRPNTIYSYTFSIAIADKVKKLDRTIETLTAKEMYDAIKDMRGSKVPMTFTDIWGETHEVYMTELRYIPRRFESGGSGDPREVEGYIRTTLVVATNEGV